MIGRRHLDLHVHTTASDGALSPRQVVELARRSRLAVLAITDHDTVAGVAEGLRAGRELGLEVVPGVEISVDSPGGSMHMVGLFIDPANPTLAGWLEDMRRARSERYPRIVARLRELGVEITEAEVEAEAGESVIGRPHIARLLVRRGVVRSHQEAFQLYLGTGAAAYVPRRRVGSRDAIELIHRAGGLAVLAHYTSCLKNGNGADFEKTLRELCDQGLDGLETYYHSFSPEEERRALSLARSFGLLRSGGSDFHGPAPSGYRLGLRPRIPFRVFRALKRSRRRARGNGVGGCA